MTALRNVAAFCEKRGVSRSMQKEFETYCRTYQADKLHISNGSTAKFMVSKMTEEELKSKWADFVCSIKRRIGK